PTDGVREPSSRHIAPVGGQSPGQRPGRGPELDGSGARRTDERDLYRARTARAPVEARLATLAVVSKNFFAALQIVEHRVHVRPAAGRRRALREHVHTMAPGGQAEGHGA